MANRAVRSRPGQLAFFMALTLPIPCLGQDTVEVSAFATIGPHPAVVWSAVAQDTGRPRSVELSPGYYTRLKIHRIGSFVALPLFAGEYLLGERLLDDDDDSAPGWVKPAHTSVALALGAVFTTNTITGAWNLWASRHQPAGRTRRLVHTALMLAADAGFVYTASLAGDAGGEDGAPRSAEGGRKHRNAAIASISLATVSTVMMWLWKS
jgi:hypothetical protein